MNLRQSSFKGFYRWGPGALNFVQSQDVEPHPVAMQAVWIGITDVQRRSAA